MTWRSGTQEASAAPLVEYTVNIYNQTFDEVFTGAAPIGRIYNGTTYVDFTILTTVDDEYKNRDNVWTKFVGVPYRDEFRGSDQKARVISNGVAGSWQGPWQ